MSKFTLSNGKEFEVTNIPHYGKYLKIRVKREYLSGPKKGEVLRFLTDEEIEAMPDRKVTKVVHLFDRDSEQSYDAKDTFLIAINKDYKEYDTVNYYSEDAINTRSKQKIEIVLRLEEWTRRLFFEWTGNIRLCDFMCNIEDDLYYELKEEPEKHGGIRWDDDCECLYIAMSTDDGDVDWIEIDRPSELTNSIVSARVIEFSQEILKKGEY